MKLNTIYCEDCLVGMERIPDGSIDMILCDLPYGTTQCEWDSLIPMQPLWVAYRRVLKANGAIVLTAQQPFATDLINAARDMYRYEIIWEKPLALGFFNAKKMPLRAHENILVFYRKLPVYNPQMWVNTNATIGRRKIAKNKSSLYSTAHSGVYTDDGSRYPRSVVKFDIPRQLFGKMDEFRFHPTQKPVALFEWLIHTYTNEGDTVLDNCMGSGTTAIACICTGRNFIGFETNAEYHAKSLQRIEAEFAAPVPNGGGRTTDTVLNHQLKIF